ncbi:hypothetical protein J132_02047 [Termitomyces sp. J132]|nr:hypothetical protein H2248_007346 [Termitomyces sp. 'cryptogamus']KNZ81276.1 hypothetical protein J132_02047 [Termitomyces sp. J132]
MAVKRSYVILVLVIFILAQVGDGRPFAAALTDEVLSFVTDASPTSVLVTTTVVRIDHSGTAASFIRTDNPTSSNTINSTQMSKLDSNATVAVSTIVGIVVFLPLLIAMLIYPWTIAGHEVDVFHIMRRLVHHPRPTSNTRIHISRTSLRSTSSVSGISYASTECAVPMKEVRPPQKPAPVLVKDGSPADCSYV